VLAFIFSEDCQHIAFAGEHTDWAGSFRRFNSSLEPGRTIVVGTNAGLFARVREHPSALVMTTTTDKGEKKGPFEIPMTPKGLLAIAAEGGFWSYAAGVAYKIMTDYRVNGIIIDNYKYAEGLACNIAQPTAPYCWFAGATFP
jgi:galactokinase